MLNSELLAYKGPANLLTAIERQRQYLIHLHVQTPPCPGCGQGVNAFTARGVEIDAVDYLSGTSDGPFACPNCERGLKMVVPWISLAGPGWHWALTLDAPEPKDLGLVVAEVRWPSLKRTPQEIAAKLEAVAGIDLFGTMLSDLLDFVPYVLAKPFIKADATAENWARVSAAAKDPKVQLVEYLPFAWGKANDCRGLSAARSLDHMKAWLWLMGEDALLTLPGLGDDAYEYYGKPQLRAICEHLSVDWRALDNGVWCNDEGGMAYTPDDVPALPLPEAASCS